MFSFQFEIHHYSIQLLQTIFTTPLLSNLSTQNQLTYYRTTQTLQEDHKIDDHVANHMQEVTTSTIQS